MEKYLSNTETLEMYNVLKSYQDVAQTKLYKQIQNTYKLSVSTSYRGDSADAVKDYLTRGPLNLLTEALDITSDITTITQLIAETFYQYESSRSGRVSSSCLEEASQEAYGLVSNFHSSMDAELDGALNEASQYVSVSGFNLDGLDRALDGIRKALQTMREDMESIDSQCLREVESLYSRIEKFNSQVKSVTDYCYSGWELNTDAASSMTAQSWYRQAGNVTLAIMMEENPFDYVAGHYSVSEDQWAKGLCEDVYAYAGYEFWSGSGEAGRENGTAFAKGSAAVLKGNAYAQFTEYLRAQVDAKVFYGEGDAKVGWSDDYKGFHVSGKVGLIMAEAKAVAGSEDFYAFAKGSAKVCAAEGDVAWEFEDGEFAIGAKGSADAASAKGQVGLSFLSVDVESETLTGEKEKTSLFQLKAAAKAGISADAGIWLEGEKVIEHEYYNINTLNFSINLDVVLGAEIDITVPYIYPKIFNWEE